MNKVLLGANTLISLSLIKQSNEKKFVDANLFVSENTVRKLPGRLLLNEREAVTSWT